MKNITLEFTEDEYANLAAFVAESEPDCSVEKYVYLATLRTLKIYLVGVLLGSKHMGESLLASMDKVAEEKRTEKK